MPPTAKEETENPDEGEEQDGHDAQLKTADQEQNNHVGKKLIDPALLMLQEPDTIGKNIEDIAQQDDTSPLETAEQSHAQGGQETQKSEPMATADTEKDEQEPESQVTRQQGHLEEILERLVGEERVEISRPDADGARNNATAAAEQTAQKTQEEQTGQENKELVAPQPGTLEKKIEQILEEINREPGQARHTRKMEQRTQETGMIPKTRRRYGEMATGREKSRQSRITKRTKWPNYAEKTQRPAEKPHRDYKEWGDIGPAEYNPWAKRWECRFGRCDKEAPTGILPYNHRERGRPGHFTGK